MAYTANNYVRQDILSEMVENISLPEYQKVLVDNVYQMASLLKFLKMKCKDTQDGGKRIITPLIKEKQSAGGFYAGADVLNTTQPNTLTQVEYLFQNVYEPIQVTRDEVRENAGVAHKILDITKVKMQLAEKGIADRLNEALAKQVSGSQNFLSLADIVGTGSLGNIDGSSETFWQAQSASSGSFALQGLTDMRTLYGLCSAGQSSDTPNAIFTTQTIWNKFESTLQPRERIQNTMAANAGFESLTFAGKDVMWDKDIDSGVIYFLNTEYLKLMVDTETDLYLTEFLKPINQQTRVAFILWRGNLITNNRRRQGKLTSVS